MVQDIAVVATTDNLIISSCIIYRSAPFSMTLDDP